MLPLAAAAVQVLLPSGLVPANAIGAAYASYNIDPSCNRGFHSIDFSNGNLAAAGRALAPAVLRFGGSGADALVRAVAGRARVRGGAAGSGQLRLRDAWLPQR